MELGVTWDGHGCTPSTLTAAKPPIRSRVHLCHAVTVNDIARFVSKLGTLRCPSPPPTRWVKIEPSALIVEHEPATPIPNLGGTVIRKNHFALGEGAVLFHDEQPPLCRNVDI